MQGESILKTLDQELLAWAHQSVTTIGGEPSDRKKYKTAVKGSPAFIQSCGLAQAYAFWMAKDNEFGYHRLRNHLSNAPGLQGLDASVRDADIETYSFLTQRTQSALVFLKRMVDAYIEDK